LGTENRFLAEAKKRKSNDKEELLEEYLTGFLQNKLKLRN